MSEFIRRVRRDTKPITSRLPQLDIELTERCNSDCVHCCINRPANDSAAKSSEMDAIAIKDLLRQAADLGCLRVRFTGGEPLLRPDFEELYLYARRLGLQVWIFTNGRLITPRLADLFAHIPPLALIEITVYGMHAESYEVVTRAPGSFVQFRRGANLLLERGIPFVVKSVLLPQNKHEVEEFEAWAKTIPFMAGPPAYATSLDLRSRRDEAKNKQIACLRLPPEDKLAMIARHAPEYRRRTSEFAAKFIGPRGSPLFGCGAGHNLCVDAYGYIQPCMTLRSPEWTLNLAEHSLVDALEHFRGLSGLCAENPEYLRRCARCFLKGFCEQCPAKSWIEHGNLDTPVDYICEAAHGQARYLGWLRAGESAWDVANWSERAGNQL